MSSPSELKILPELPAIIWDDFTKGCVLLVISQLITLDLINMLVSAIFKGLINKNFWSNLKPVHSIHIHFYLVRDILLHITLSIKWVSNCFLSSTSSLLSQLYVDLHVRSPNPPKYIDFCENLSSDPHQDSLKDRVSQERLWTIPERIQTQSHMSIFRYISKMLINWDSYFLAICRKLRIFPYNICRCKSWEF